MGRPEIHHTVDVIYVNLVSTTDGMASKYTAVVHRAADDLGRGRKHNTPYQCIGRPVTSGGKHKHAIQYVGRPMTSGGAASTLQ